MAQYNLHREFSPKYRNSEYMVLYTFPLDLAVIAAPHTLAPFDPLSEPAAFLGQGEVRPQRIWGFGFPP